MVLSKTLAVGLSIHSTQNLKLSSSLLCVNVLVLHVYVHNTPYSLSLSVQYFAMV